MTRAWKCDRCNTVHTSNPSDCRSCGYNIFEPVSADELRQHGAGVERPDALDLDGTKQPAFEDAGGDDSPDLNPDGSLKTPAGEQDQSGFWNTLRSLLP